jgi:hypothetical protein
MVDLNFSTFYSSRLPLVIRALVITRPRASLRSYIWTESPGSSSTTTFDARSVRSAVPMLETVDDR